MDLSYAVAETEIVCGFISNARDPKPGPAFQQYSPIVDNEFDIGINSEFKMIYGKDISRDLCSYNENTSNKNLTRDVKRNKKIIVTGNDVIADSTEIVLNFTEHKITVYDKYNIPRVFLLLENDLLRERYRGNVIIFAIHRLNNPFILADAYGKPKSYLKTLIDSLQFKQSSKHKDLLKLLKFADDYWENVDSNSLDGKTNSLKIITATSVSSEDLMKGNQSTGVGIHFPNKCMTITLDSIYNYHDTPSVGSDVDISRIKSDLIPGSRFVYIVDNHDQLNDRYIHIYNSGYKIPKFKSSKQTDGLYVVMVDDNCNFKIEAVYPIEEIDQSKLVFKTLEEAQFGADRITQYAQDIKENDLTQQRDMSQKKTELEQLRHDNEMMKLAMDKQTRQNETRINKMQHDNEVLLTKFKHRLEKSKSKNEKKKVKNESIRYDKDKTMETIKLAGAIAGGLSTMFLIYRQFVK